MASPQKEDGYTAIANEIMDALCHIRIPGEERQVLDAILRKTYGWNKCEDAISLSQFVEITGLKKPHIIQSIKGLLLKKVISVTEKGNEPAKVYKFNKNYDEWIPLPKKVTLPKKVISVTEKGNLALPKTVPTKDTITKDTITKDRDAFPEAVIEKENHTLFPAPFLFPQWVPENTFLEFVQLRKKLRKPLSAESYQRFFIKLKKLCDDDTTGETTAELILDQSIVNGWQGIFELKKSNNGNNGGKAEGVVKV